MVRIVAVVLVIIAVGFQADVAIAKSVDCTKVDNRATVSVSSNRSVSVTTGDKTCDFSIDGASASSMTQATFLNAMKTFGMDFPSLSSDDHLELFRQLLGVPDDLKDTFLSEQAGNESDVSNCLATALFEDDKPFTSHNAFCTFVALGDDGFKDPLIGAVRAISDGSEELIIGATVGGQGYFSFIPATFIAYAKSGQIQP